MSWLIEPKAERKVLVFVLDVTADFQPWLVERKRLCSSIDTFDDFEERSLLLLDWPPREGDPHPSDPSRFHWHFATHHVIPLGDIG